VAKNAHLLCSNLFERDLAQVDKIDASLIPVEDKPLILSLRAEKEKESNKNNKDKRRMRSPSGRGAAARGRQLASKSAPQCAQHHCPRPCVQPLHAVMKQNTVWYKKITFVTRRRRKLLVQLNFLHHERLTGRSNLSASGRSAMIAIAWRRVTSQLTQSPFSRSASRVSNNSCCSFTVRKGRLWPP